MSDLKEIPGIGKTFEKDFARIGITKLAQLANADPEKLFQKLVQANADEDHKTSKSYLYVIRMAIYYARGGRDKEKLRWNVWRG
jgi:Pathogenicity locus